MNVYYLILVCEATGIDKTTFRHARKKKIQVRCFVAHRGEEGRAAAFTRNDKVIDECGGIIAFWDGSNRETLNGIESAQKAGKLLAVVDQDGKIIDYKDVKPMCLNRCVLCKREFSQEMTIVHTTDGTRCCMDCYRLKVLAAR